MISFKKNGKNEKNKEMTSQDRDRAIKRAELERRKIDSEIENILLSYAKESGNSALRRRRHLKKQRYSEWDF